MTTAVLVGLVWAAWHLWTWAAPGGAQLFSWSVLAATFVRMVSTALVYAWIYNSARGSLLIVMLAHVGHDVAIDIVGGASSADVSIAILYLIVAVLVVATTASRTLTRRKETLRLPS